MSIELLCDLRSGRKILRRGTVLKVIVSNDYGARAVDDEGDIHVIEARDFRAL